MQMHFFQPVNPLVHIQNVLATFCKTKESGIRVPIYKIKHANDAIIYTVIDQQRPSLIE